MDTVDFRRRGKISIQHIGSVNASSILAQRLLADVLLVLVLNAAKDYLLADLGVFWVLVRVLACGGLIGMVWLVTSGQLHSKRVTEWSVVGVSSLLLFLRYAGLFTALYRLSTTRAILFTHFSTFWLKSLIDLASVKRASLVVLSLTLSFLWDARFSVANFVDFFPGYGALLVHGLASTAMGHTEGVLSPSLGHAMYEAVSILGACMFSLPLYTLRHFLLPEHVHRMPTLGTLAVLPCLAYVVLHLVPRCSVSTNVAVTSPRYIVSSYATTYVAAILLGYLGFGHLPKTVDVLVPGFLLYGIYPAYTQPSRGASSYYATMSRLMRAYLKDILSNPESRKIFYFLMLNMCYMLIQMLYGIWTNSLGLISDAIHMAFDCMAIAVGLIASVMARWPPNETFTYGYGRIETLSGFANGIFLILISVFIIFEAIQRLLDPPEMNTSQLLLVSTLGLAVNLFGMFAMGGHHHHGGHSHSHSHGHDHGHSHAPLAIVPSTSPAIHDHTHSHSHCNHDLDDGRDHTHSHSHSLTPHHSHSPPSPLSPLPGGSYIHSHSASHVPSEPDTKSKSDSHTAHGHGHSHSHSHAPNQPEAAGPLSSLSSSQQGLHSRHQSLEVKVSPSDLLVSSNSHARLHAEATVSPLTPKYQFGHDEHFQTHHSHSGSDAHAPNLHDHSHVHDHAHEGHSHNMRGVFLHVMADTLGSVGVIVSTLLIQWYGWTGFDPIASLFIAVLIAASVVPLVIDSGKVLALDLDSREKAIRDALSELTPVEGLASYSAPRFWPKDSSSIIGTIHVQLAPSASSVDPGGPHSSVRTTFASVNRVVERVDKLLRSRIAGLEELTIQVEDSTSLHSHTSLYDSLQ